MSGIEQINGLWWPTSPDAREVQRRAKRFQDASAAAFEIDRLAPRRSCVIQAGGHIGLWPMTLYRSFARVVTFEPDERNYRCLKLNTRTMEDMTVVNSALGHKHGYGTVVRTKAHQHLSGAGYVVPGSDVPIVTIDETCEVTAQGDVAAIVLDVEGGEYNALLGAQETLKRDCPLVVVEAGMFTERPGVRPLIDIAKLLAFIGYGPPQKFPVGKHNYYFEVS